MPPTQNPLKSLSEFRTENSINNRIEGGVEVAQPQSEAHDVTADVTGVATERKKEG